jgi:hypothetical protein
VVRVGGGLLAAAAVLGTGVLLGRASASTEPVDAARWLAEWSRSAGFGGTAAIVAATIAYRATRANARRQHWVDRKVQWWARAQWALDRVLSDDRRTQVIGVDMLAALGFSEWAGEHEEELIEAALSGALERYPLDDRRAGSGRPGSGGRRGEPAPPDSDEEVGR